MAQVRGISYFSLSSIRAKVPVRLGPSRPGLVTSKSMETHAAAGSGHDVPTTAPEGSKPIFSCCSAARVSDPLEERRWAAAASSASAFAVLLR